MTPVRKEDQNREFFGIYTKDQDMDWIERMNRALEYVEGHLDEFIDPAEIARLAATGNFHFQRMFSLLCGVTLGDYIRRRRLTLAAGEIRQGRAILETAVKYGYESQAAFSRAFHRLHGFSPGATRDPGRIIKAYPPLSFHLSIQGEESMDYEIRDLKAFKLAGLVRRVTSRDEDNLIKIPEFWQEVKEEGFDPFCKGVKTDGLLGGGLLGVCLNFSEDTEDFDYMIGVEPNSDDFPSAWRLEEVPAMAWAIFKGTGPMPEAIQKLWKRIYGEWFPATDYIHAVGPEIEVYRECRGNEQDFEIWIPVRKQ